MAKKSSKNAPPASLPRSADKDSGTPCALRHFRIGWWSLLLFLSLGILLEALHGFKIGWFLDVGMETRRLMWRLAHAHGTLLSILHVAFGGMAVWVGNWGASRRATASFCLSTSAILIPVGFFLGGLYIYEGDPGLGIMLVPVGAALLFVAVLLTAMSLHSLETKETTTRDRD